MFVYLSTPEVLALLLVERVLVAGQQLVLLLLGVYPVARRTDVVGRLTTFRTSPISED
jgi:hypothetical protein